MGLKMSHEVNSGVVGDYWRINQIIISDGKGYIFLELYLSKLKKDSGRVPVDRLDFMLDDFTELELSQLNITPLKLAYTKLKELELFKEAIDEE